MSIKWFLYKIALKYIGWCNGRPSDIMYDQLKNMDRLTYRNCDKAYLSYGADEEWSKFKSYEVLDNAIQRLTEYEDVGEMESVDPLMSLRKICDIIDMPWALNGGKEFTVTVGVTPDLDKHYVLCNGYRYDTRVGMFILIRNLAVRFDTWNKYAGREDVLYIHSRMGGYDWETYLKKGELMNQPWFLDRVDDSIDSTYCDFYAKIDISKDGGGTNVNTNN